METQRREVVTVFERVPDLFVRIYDGQFQAWGRHFARIGGRARIRFRKPLEAMPFAIDRRRVVGVVMLAEVVEDTPARMVVKVRPSNAAAEEAIQRHTAELAREELARA